MSGIKKHTSSEVHDGTLYPEDEKHKAALSPSSRSENGHDPYFSINEKALLRKLDLKLLPALTLLYLLSFLDRSNGRPFQPYLSLLELLTPAKLPMRVSRAWW